MKTCIQDSQIIVIYFKRIFQYNLNIDRLTKSAHFLPIRETTPIHELAEIFHRDIVRLHGMLVSIVSNRDTRFTSHF